MTREQMLIRIAGAMFGGAVVISCLSVILQSPGCSSQKKQAPYWLNPDSEEKLSKSLANIKIMRSKIEPWCLKNADILKEMHQSNDPEIINKVIQRIPQLPINLRSNYEGLDFGPLFVGELKPEICDSIGVMNVDISRITKTKDQENTVKGWINQTKLKQSTEFNKINDIAWFQSNNNGPFSYKLYVSGRVTKVEKPLVIKTDMHQESVETEVMPPF